LDDLRAGYAGPLCSSAGYDSHASPLRNAASFFLNPYATGLTETDRSMINKMLTDMTNSGKISEALAKKVEELSDFLKRQNSR
jgi:hypothetical protein